MCKLRIPSIDCNVICDPPAGVLVSLVLWTGLGFGQVNNHVGLSLFLAKAFSPPFIIAFWAGLRGRDS